MKKAIGKSGLCLVLLLSIFVTARLRAATEYFVIIDDDDKFKPATLQIQLGDTVTWKHQDYTFAPHTTTSDDGYWDSGDMEPDDRYSITPPITGTFFYHDEWSAATGSIAVSGATTNAPITLSEFKILGGKFQFNIEGLTVGKTNYVQASTNLTDWISLRTNVATAITSSFTNTSLATLPAQFYRVTQLP